VILLSVIYIEFIS